MHSARWILTAVEGRFTGREFAIPAAGLTLGREEDNDLVLEDDNISRHHAALSVVGDRVVLQDLKSRNGTYVNNRKISRVVLREGDRIALGSHLFEVKDEAVREDLVQEKTEVIPEFEGELESISGQAAPDFMAEDEGPTILEARPSRSAKETAPDAGAPAFGLGPSDPEEKTNILPPRVIQPPPLRLGTEAGLDERPGGRDAERHDEAAGEAPAEGQADPGRADEWGVGWDDDPLAAERGPVQTVLPPARAPRARKRRRPMIVGLLVLVGVGTAIGMWSHMRTPSEQTPATQALARPQWHSSEVEIPVRCRVPSLSEAEKAMRPRERLDAANEHFDQGEIFLLSEKLREACDEFEYALALNPDCKVCLIRLGKTKAEIKRRLEKYKNDAIRAHSAMEYDKAMRYWQLALELESDPEGRRIIIEGIRDAKNQKQSYR